MQYNQTKIIKQLEKEHTKWIIDLEALKDFFQQIEIVWNEFKFINLKKKKNNKYKCEQSLNRENSINENFR